MTSDLTHELGFALCGDPIHRSKVGSLIAPIKTYQPKKMEIWVFREYAHIMPHSIINTSLQTDPDAVDDDEDGSFEGESARSPGIQKMRTQNTNLAPKADPKIKERQQ